MKSIDYSLFDYDVKDYAARYHVEYAPVMSCAHPFGLFHAQRPEKAVLLLHGFTGYPGELIRPAVDFYEAGLDCLAIRYPGHGTSADDFLETNDAMWLATAEDAYKDLRAKYKEVYVAGHSMGGAIAVILSGRLQIPRVDLIAPALVLRNAPWRACLVRPFLSSFKTGWSRDPEYRMYYKNAPCDDEAMGEQYWKLYYPKQICHLCHIASLARKSVSSLDSKILVVMGDKDAAVDQRSAALICNANHGQPRSVIIKNGTHLLPYDKDEKAQDEAMAECLRNFTE